MSQVDVGSTFSQDQELPPTSAAAVASLVMGLIFCVPGISFLAMIFGGIGIARTSGGIRRGRGMAVAGIILGFLVSTSWLGIAWGVSYFAPSILFVFEGPNESISAAFDGKNEEVRAVFIPESAPGDASIEKFVSTVRAEYGVFELAMPDQEDDPPFGAQKFELPFTFQFENGSVPGVIGFEVSEEPTPGGSFLRMSSLRLTPEDSSEGDIILGGAPSATTSELEEDSEEPSP